MSLSLRKNTGQARPLQAVRVLVVDDHPMVRYGLSALISVEPGFEVCGQADSEDSALQAVKESRPGTLLQQCNYYLAKGLFALQFT